MSKPKAYHLKRIIVLRFSAMGDVAIVASFLKEFAVKYPDIEIIMVSRELFRPFFADIPQLTFHPIYPKTEHKGFTGLYKLYKELKKYRPDAIADLHENIRSRIVSMFFRWSGTGIRRIDKGRAAKKALTRSENKILKPLRPTIERYADVFRHLGFSINLSHKLHSNKKPLPKDLQSFFRQPNKNIGISPFAQHAYKMYSLQKMEEVLGLLCAEGCQLYIFGGGAQEREVAENWSAIFPNVHNLIGIYTLSEELNIISNLDVMLSMDSSGMHLASLMGVPVISVWGPTHPYAGFLGYGQSETDCVQVAHPARPNSVYGNKPCLCGNLPCMELISPQMIFDRITAKLNEN